MTTPLTALLQGKLKNMYWTDAAQEVFDQLKQRFTTAPILHQPNHTLPFIVKVNTWNFREADPSGGKL